MLAKCDQIKKLLEPLTELVKADCGRLSGSGDAVSSHVAPQPPWGGLDEATKEKLVATQWVDCESVDMGDSGFSGECIWCNICSWRLLVPFVSFVSRVASDHCDDYWACKWCQARSPVGLAS